MKKQSLNGIWNYRIGKGQFTEREVPFSALPVGHSECQRRFDLIEKSDRVLLRFDGITYFARVTLNGKMLGEMLAYCEYTFDITDTVREKDNLLTVELEDISPEFGPTEGWGNYGGITRGVSLIYTASTYIDNVFFKTSLKNGYKDAEYRVELSKNGSDCCEYSVALSFDGITVDEYRVKDGEKAPLRTLSDVHLWSPDTPCLYELTVKLFVNGTEVDAYTENVGFREFSHNRHRFMLNGEELFLQGVCRHEMYGDYGHTVPTELIEKDLRQIKETGSNYVRLVHYPHCKETLEICDRIGLMVSEEPGLWWSDTSNPAVSTGALEVMRRTVIRDRNHPSIVFWLCFNECEFTEQYLIDSARVCRENDDTRLVSGANCMSNEDTLKYYNICGFDFYTMHPYSRTIDRSLESARVLHDKPLMFTEWGGYHVYDNPHLFTDFVNAMYGLYRQNSDEGALAGASFWYWAEVTDFSRGRPACIDGTLKEALVDKQRKPTMIYRYFCEAWKNARIETPDTSLYEYTALDTIDKKAFTCTVTPDMSAVFERANAVILPKFTHMRKHKVTVGPFLQREEIKGMSLVPNMLTLGNELSYKGNVNTDCITLIGMTSLINGYPIAGEYGEEIARICVRSVDGDIERFVIRNGVDVTHAFTSIGSSKINPCAEKAKRFAELSYDKNFENYCINRLDLKLSGVKQVESIVLEAVADGYDILIYGIFG